MALFKLSRKARVYSAKSTWGSGHYPSMADIVVMTAEQLREVVRGAVRDALKEAQAGDLVSATVSGLSPRTFRRLVRTGKLDGKKVGRAYLVKRESLERYLAERDAPKVAPKFADGNDDPIQRALESGRLRVLAK
jgi:excisionase family DNA binding protein